MKLVTVTLAGVDESVSARDLRSLSEKYSFVEWGVLISADREGVTPRYPSQRWRDLLVAEARDANMFLSAHLCGRRARNPNPTIGYLYNRVQLNGASTPHEVKNAFLEAADTGVRRARDRYIAQARSVTALEIFLSDGITTLYDASGGEGISPGAWPVVNVKHDDEPVVGFAGGLGPKNIKQVLTELCAREGDQPFWVDMESSLRIDNNRRFSLEVAEHVLELAKPFVSGLW